MSDDPCSWCQGTGLMAVGALGYHEHCKHCDIGAVRKERDALRTELEECRNKLPTEWMDEALALRAENERLKAALAKGYALTSAMEREHAKVADMAEAAERERDEARAEIAATHEAFDDVESASDEVQLRIRALEAQCAALKDALGRMADYSPGDCPTGEDMEAIRFALSSTAGTAILERLARLEEVAKYDGPPVTWRYAPPSNEELALFWTNPWSGQEEKIATFWWPGHPLEATSQVEQWFEQVAARAALAPSPGQVEKDDTSPGQVDESAKDRQVEDGET